MDSRRVGSRYFRHGLTMDSLKRQQARAELTAQGYSWDYVDSWPPKIDMWNHVDLKNIEGVVVAPAGKLFPNQPGHPDHAARKSRIGFLPWEPSETCKCRGCRTRYAPTPEEPLPERVMCSECGFEPQGNSIPIQKRNLISHSKKHAA